MVYMYFYNISAMRRHRNGKYYDVPTGCLVAVTAVGLSTFLIPVGIAVGSTVYEDEQRGKVYNSIAVSYGEETRQDNLKGEEVHKEPVDVVYQDDNTLVVYVYGKDDEQRYLYTEFVESNIYVIEQDGQYKVCLNQDDLTEENYNAFVESFEENEDESRIQRKRS